MGDADDADAWWEQLTPERKDQIRRWISGSAHAVVMLPHPGQLAIDDLDRDRRRAGGDGND